MMTHSSVNATYSVLLGIGINEHVYMINLKILNKLREIIVSSDYPSDG
jgi:hypothetical protein